MENERSNVAQLHAAIGSQPRKPRRNRLLSKRRQRRAAVLLGVFGVILVCLGLQLVTTNAQVRSMHADTQQEQARLQKREQEQKQLKHREKLLNNPDYVKALAHSKYDYAKPGETNYHFVKK
ncbi:septum formation initiator family protein [Fructilactobacillus ixorae]|uniref:Septum formation initiator family protein n=1 Tax=Fructilactobacillus ixorae TaxID=1750535 RepID=A0ABY5C6U6_9LACO|nr:septum formation initiator family protein [Fructilactobacillus ixorae]USS93553.1 septum formation initiator family protein [Fructilactobacillus ixorae]